LRILVTGGAGYIGGSVAQLLLEAGNDVVVYDNLSHGHRWAVPAAAKFVQGDVADRAKLEAVFSADHFDGVMHFAALIEAGESMRLPELYFRNNTGGTLALLEAMDAQDVQRLVFSSTAAVYGEPESTPILEDARLHPTNPYGASKLLSEQMMDWMQRIYHTQTARLRYFNVAGALDQHRGEAHQPESHLIPLVLDVALGRRPNIDIYGTDYPTPDGTCIRDYIHVRDLAQAHLLVLDQLASGEMTADTLGTPGSQIYNLGNGHGFSVREVVESARRVTGHPIPVIEKPRRPGDPAVLVASSTKIQKELGWQPKFTTLDDIISSAWTWHQKHFGRKAK
jgi:UDP-glucose 4-epimerase